MGSAVLMPNALNALQWSELLPGRIMSGSNSTLGTMRTVVPIIDAPKNLKYDHILAVHNEIVVALLPPGINSKYK
jgi:hypothetical protein